MDKSIKFSIIASLLLISSSIAYYLVVFTPQNESRKREDKIEQIVKNKIDLDKCIADVAESYKNFLKLNWTPVPWKEGVYNADLAVFNKADNEKNEKKSFCLKRYSN